MATGHGTTPQVPAPPRPVVRWVLGAVLPSAEAPLPLHPAAARKEASPTKHHVNKEEEEEEEEEEVHQQQEQLHKQQHPPESPAPTYPTAYQRYPQSITTPTITTTPSPQPPLTPTRTTMTHPAGTVGAPGGPPFEERGRSGMPTYTGTQISGSSATYTILGFLLLLGAILALIMPDKLTDIFFRGQRAYYDILFQELWRILAATLIAAAATTYALKVASDQRVLHDPVVQRLQLGFFWFALLSVLLHLIHIIWIKSLTFGGLLLGALLMAPTLLLPSVHLSMTGGFGLSSIASNAGYALGNIFAPRHVSLATMLYSLLTVLSVVAGLLYIIIPRSTLQWVFGYHADKRAIFLWQWIGSGMLFLFPALTYTCLERGIEGVLWRYIPRSLNVGLLLAALFNIFEYGVILASEGILGRWLLPILFVHWCLMLLASILGLMHGGGLHEHPIGSGVYEYEPLHSGESMA